MSARFPVVFATVAVVACISQASLLAITIALPATLLSRSDLYGRASGAATLNVLVFFTLLGIVAWLLLSPPPHSTTTVATHTRRAAALCTYCLTFIAMILSIDVLGSAWRRFGFSTSSLRHDAGASLIAGGISMWTIAVISQVALHLLIARSAVHPDNEATIPLANDRPYLPPSPKRPFSMGLKSFAAPDRSFGPSMAEPYSSSFTSYQSPRSSFRNSVSQVLGPIGSKTRLLAHSLHSRDSQSQFSRREPSLEIACRGDGFDTWDTSAVEEQLSKPPAAKKTRPRLAPIPGSRPTSPAKPLDGPFPGPSHPTEPHSPQSPGSSPPESPAYTAPTSPVSEGSVCSLQLPPTVKDTDQNNIHPLFRSGSPGPPPAASPGTTVMASPFGGKVVSPEHAAVPKKLRSFHNSQPSTPGNSSPLAAQSEYSFAVSSPVGMSGDGFSGPSVPRSPYL